MNIGTTKKLHIELENEEIELFFYLLSLIIEQHYQNEPTAQVLTLAKTMSDKMKREFESIHY